MILSSACVTGELDDEVSVELLSSRPFRLPLPSPFDDPPLDGGGLLSLSDGGGADELLLSLLLPLLPGPSPDTGFPSTLYDTPKGPQ